MSTKYIARYNGKIVGKRTSQNRTYTHAWVIQYDETAARDAAYNYKASHHDRPSYDYECEIAAQGIDHWAVKVEAWRPVPDYKRIEQAKEAIEGGFEGYVARQRVLAITWFERNLKNGHYEPHVGGWASRLDLARKASASRGGHLVAIVPAEAVGKPAPKLAQAGVDILNGRS
jgi:hypothetical protein